MLRQAVADAAEDLDQLAAHTGAMVPLGEIVFVSALPATVYRVDGCWCRGHGRALRAVHALDWALITDETRTALHYLA